MTIFDLQLKAIFVLVDLSVSTINAMNLSPRGGQGKAKGFAFIFEARTAIQCLQI